MHKQIDVTNGGAQSGTRDESNEKNGSSIKFKFFGNK